MKNQTLYKIIVGGILVLPISITILIYTFILGITPDVIFNTSEIEKIHILEINENRFIYSEDDSYVMTGELTVINGKLGAFIYDDSVIRVGNKFYNSRFNKETEKYEFIDYEVIKKQEKTSWSFPISILIMAVSILIVALVISGKMHFKFTKPRLYTFLSLLLITVFLFIVNQIIGDMLVVFLVATASWGSYCIMYLVNQGMLSDSDKDKGNTLITKALQEALKKIK